MHAMVEEAMEELAKLHLPHDLAENDEVQEDFAQLMIVFADLHLTAQDDDPRKYTARDADDDAAHTENSSDLEDAENSDG